MRTESFRLLAALAIAILLIWGGSAMLLWQALPDWPTRGSFGDMFGAINALFAGLAFAGVVFALVLQRKELALQRQELSAQREELRLNRAELARAAEAQKQAQLALRDQVLVSYRAARLSALGNLIEHYAMKIAATSVAADKERLRRTQLTFIDLLEAELSQLAMTEGGTSDG